jgi:hypothetical protein
VTKQKNNTIIIHILLVLPILIFSVAGLQASKTNEDIIKEPLTADATGISNIQVHSACRDAIYEEDDELVQQMGVFICRMSQDMVYEQNIYEQRYAEFFKEEGHKEPLYVLEGISVTGCNISELERKSFTALIIHYFDNHSDELKDSFFWTMEAVLKPYCNELKDASIEFHLDENEDRSIT